MPLIKVPVYQTRNLATEIDSGARSILPGTNVTFSVDPVTGQITINSSGGLGTVTSVGATGSTGLAVGGSPITTAGVLTFTLSANLQGWSGINPATGVGGPYVLKVGDTMTGTLNGTAISMSGAGTFGGNVTAPQNFVASTANVVLAATGAGSVFLRPNGFASASGQLTINSAGATQINGSLTVSGNVVVNNADLYSYRTGGTAGVIFLNSAATKYLYNDGTKYIMPAQDLWTSTDIYANTSGVSPVKIGLGGGGLGNYGMIGWSGMTGTEYGMIFGSADVNTYVSSRTTGSVIVRPSANGTAGEAIFATTGMTLNSATGGKLLSKITLGTAAPGVLANGELYLRY